MQPVEVCFYIDKVFKDFFFSNRFKQLITYTFTNNDLNSIKSRDRQDDYFVFAVYLGHKQSYTVWTQLYFTGWLSDIGGLFTSIMAIAKFFISGYQEFVVQKSMLKRLYGEE